MKLYKLRLYDEGKSTIPKKMDIIIALKVSFVNPNLFSKGIQERKQLQSKLQKETDQI